AITWSDWGIRSSVISRSISRSTTDRRSAGGAAAGRAGRRGRGAAPGPLRRGTAGVQLDRLVARWREDAHGQSDRLTIRLIKDRDERRDIGGGSRIPRAADDGETARALAGAGTD